MRYRVGLMMFAAMLGGCAEKKPVAAVAPAAPVAPKPQLPATPPAVIGIQNTTVIPAPQAVPPAAVAQRELPPPPPLAGERVVTPPRPPATRSPKPTPEVVTAVPAPATVPATVAEPAEQPLVSRLEPSRRVDVRSAAEINDTLRDVNALIKQLSASRLDNAGKEALARARSLVRLSEGAVKRGDLAQADDLVKRAATIARDLAAHR